MIDWQLVREVSRSFYLTLRFLPRPVRASTTLGYLLARAADTIADRETIPLAERREVFAQVKAALAGEPGAAFPESLPTTGLPEGEARLLRSLPHLAEEMHRSEDADLLRDLLGKITDGQAFDLDRFHTENVEVLTTEELEQYTYEVAGSVGEFWTRLGKRHLGAFAVRPQAEMEELGIRYGKGLQLVNMLRDLPNDLEVGRAYLDASSLGHLFGRARGYIDAGFDYAAALRSGRMRYATVLPAALALPTLDRIEAVGAEFPVKVSRRETNAVLRKCWPAFLWRRGARAARSNAGWL